MCTAISYRSGNSHYMGRNLDLEYHYREEVAVTCRNYPFHFRNGCILEHHYAMIGMATIANGYPLYYEATNEHGLSAAGLNFHGNAVYQAKEGQKDNIAPFELIPWILSQCRSVKEAKAKLQNTNLWNLPFSREYPISDLHWMISDDTDCIVVEPMLDGIVIYDNPYGVLTNNPPFPYHQHHLAEFMQLSPKQAINHFCQVTIKPYSNGMGAIGLPGDFSSASRFVKATFVKENAMDDNDPVSQFFHLLSSVEMPRGCVCMPDERYEITQYSCCCDTKKGIYYYTTYGNRRITAIQMANCPLDANQVITFPLQKDQDIHWEN